MIFYCLKFCEYILLFGFFDLENSFLMLLFFFGYNNLRKMLEMLLYEIENDVLYCSLEKYEIIY